MEQSRIPFWQHTTDDNNNTPSPLLPIPLLDDQIYF